MSKYINAEKLQELIDEKWKELADKNVRLAEVNGMLKSVHIYQY